MPLPFFCFLRNASGRLSVQREKNFMQLVALAITLIHPFFAYAEGLGYDRTRLILTQEASQSSVLIKNDTPQAYVLRPQLTRIDGQAAPESSVRPPLMKLLPQHAARLRLVLDKTKLPQDRESLFWLVSHAFPAIATDASAQRLNFNFVLKMKVFYRPSSLTGNASEAARTLFWSQEQQHLIVHNNTAFYVTIAGMRINGKAHDSTLLLPPFSHTKTSLVAPAQSHLEWLIFNDDGCVESYASKLH